MRKLSSFILISVLLLCPILKLSAQTSFSDRLSINEKNLIDQGILQEMEKQKVVGMAIGIIQNGEIVYLKGYGFADRESKTPVTPSTLFNWASNSKPLTAVATMQLVEKGQLDLNANIRTYVPEYPDKNEVIDARELLCHQSGIPHYGSESKLPPPLATSPIESLSYFKDLPLLFSPGSKYLYSSYGYILLSAVIERAGNQPFFDQIKQRVAIPLGMNSLQLDVPYEGQPNWSKGYVKINDTIVPAPDLHHDWKFGAGAFKSTIGDFALFAKGLISHSLVTSTSETQMWTNQKTKLNEVTDMGLGFSVSNQKGQKISHSGSQEEVATRMALYPQQRKGVVIMCNCRYADPGNFSTIIFTKLK